MISYLEGTIIAKKINWIILKSGFVGYKIYTLPTAHFETNKKTELFIYEHIKEDADDLYGFSNISQLEIFEILLSVSGLGPKIGIAILSMLNKTQIEKAIESSDIKTFTNIKGIGKKLAAKIILELRSKVDLVDTDEKISQADMELEQVLLSLGFSKNEVKKVIEIIPKKLSKLEDKTKWSLKYLNK